MQFTNKADKTQGKENGLPDWPNKQVGEQATQSTTGTQTPTLDYTEKDYPQNQNLPVS